MATSDSTQLSGHVKDETGNVYGKLTVIEFAGVRSDHRAFWRCRCECGKMAKVAGIDLRKKHIKSCGCLGARQNGLSHSLAYDVWKAMKRRCCSINHKDYRHYGGRGITICDRWRESFLAFLEDMGPRPFPGATVERVNNDGPYSPDNCQWATRLEQAQNTRKTRLITHNGTTKSLSGWAKQLGLAHKTIAYRLNHGWSIKKALTTPPRQSCDQHCCR